jgi:Domain of unknown function (DUF4276)
VSPRKRPLPKAAAARSKPAVGLVVEGDTEFNALPLLHTKQLVPGCPPLKPINLGGVGAHVTPTGIAKMVCPHVVAHLVAGRSTVVVCLDREDRDDCKGAFAQAVQRALEAELEQTGVAVRWRPYTVHVIIADRAFESWILADAHGLHARRVFPRAPSFHSFEGQRGERGQKGAIEIGKLWEREYLKTTHGPRLFEQLRLEDARRCGKGQRGSRSLDKLLRTLGV